MKAESEIVKSYWSILKELSEDVKAELIEKLRYSLNAPLEKDRMSQSFGAWKGEESAEELINIIYSSRKFNRNLTEF